MNVLVVTAYFHPDSPGGTNRVVHSFATRLAARGHTVGVVTRRCRPDLPGREHLDGVEVRRYDIAGGDVWQLHASEVTACRRLCRRWLAERPADVVFYHNTLTARAVLGLGLTRRNRPRTLYGFYARWEEEWIQQDTYMRPEASPARRLARIPFYYYLHYLDRRNLAASRRVLVISRFVEETLVRELCVSPSKIRRLRGGVDTDRFRPDPEGARRIRERYGVRPGEMLLFTVRRLEPRMGLVTLLEVVARLSAEGVASQLVVGGCGSLRAHLEERIATLGLAGRVHLAGLVPEDQLRAHYCAADLFVLPTAALEGFGMVTLEALACGTPVVATPVAATPEILAGLDPALLAADSSSAALAATIGAWRDRVPIDDQTRRRCRDYAVSRYHWDPVIEDLERVLLETVGQRSGDPLA